VRWVSVLHKIENMLKSQKNRLGKGCKRAGKIRYRFCEIGTPLENHFPPPPGERELANIGV